MALQPVLYWRRRRWLPNRLNVDQKIRDLIYLLTKSIDSLAVQEGISIPILIDHAVLMWEGNLCSNAGVISTILCIKRRVDMYEIMTKIIYIRQLVLILASWTLQAYQGHSNNEIPT